MFCEHAEKQTIRLIAVPVCGVHCTGREQWLIHSGCVFDMKV